MIMTSCDVARTPVPASTGQQWQAVATGSTVHGGPVRGVAEFPVYAPGEATGRTVGTLWHDNRKGQWRAYRIGYGTPLRTFDTRGEALAAVNWLDTVSVSLLPRVAGRASADGRQANLPASLDQGPRVVLADGTEVNVLDATDVYAAIHERPAPGVYGPSCRYLVTLTVQPTGRRVELPTALSARFCPGVGGEAGPTGAYTLTVRSGTLLALVPPCPECGAYAGQQCRPDCLSDAPPTD